MVRSYEEQSDHEDDLDLDLDIQEGLPIQRPIDFTTDEELEAIWIWIGIIARQLFEP